ncbi:hypothetical protein [Fluviicola sp.]|uniref:hypothetical protein n=1 Tax=Fluviicola sp. TaxID=1917219 RepID=UPI00282DA857|nr:hypothetical protein [Fluviicola sp.]MDR0801393.1 hypothetical protein [Fluviicola sp.]
MASEHGGKCLSEELTDPMSDHAWCCKKGHTFDLSPFLVSKGAWCKQCYRKRIPEEHLKWLQDYAIERGGKCLSTEFKNRSTKMEFECAEGHRWELLPTTLFYDKTWCKKCAGLYKLDLDDMKRWAIERGGECLSDVYKGRYNKLRWRCGLGHEFEQTPKSLQRGWWCVECSRIQEKTQSLELMKSWAAEFGGKCLSTVYINCASSLRWECKNGHPLRRNRDLIKQRSDCGQCKVEASRVEKLEELRQYALKRNGKLLSTEYKNTKTVLEFECMKGHRWKPTAHLIFYSNTWCPECNMERLRRGKKSENSTNS